MTDIAIIVCSICDQQLRLPNKSGTLSVTCPQCKEHLGWTFPTSPPDSPPPNPPGAEPSLQHFAKLERPDDEWTHTEKQFLGCIGAIVFMWMIINSDIRGLGQLLFIIILALIVGFVSVTILIHPVVYKRRVWKYERDSCPHDIPGGMTTSQCLKCVGYLRQNVARQRAKRVLSEWHKEVHKKSSDLRQEEFKRLVDQRRHHYGNILELSPHAFEDLVSELFKRMDYTVEQTPYSNDRGKDAIAHRDGKTYLIECKRYARDRSVGRRDLQIFHSAMIEEAAAGGFFVSTGKFLKTAKEFVQGKKIELIDEEHLIGLMMRYLPYGSQEANEFRVMCEECGSIVVRRLSRPEDIVRCMRGHEVSSDWTDEMLSRAVEKGTIDPIEAKVLIQIAQLKGS